MFFILPVIMFNVIFFIIVASIIVTVIKRARGKGSTSKPSQPFQNTISNANDPNSFGNSNQDLSIYCEYCGSKLERVRKRCPNCGARVQK